MSNSTQNFSSEQVLKALREMRGKLEAANKAKTEPIAIVGMGCRFPGGANDPDSYWNLLQNGIDAIAPVPSSRWNLDDYYDRDPEVPGKTYVKEGGFIDQVDQFDAEFFGISPREAINLDPQQRLLLEVSWEALENAGQTWSQLKHSPTGVFMGICTDDYAELSMHQNQKSVNAYSGLGTHRSIAVGRISHLLGLQGPNIQLDTACSTSLVAVHLACQSLRLGESNLALAGGVNLILSPTSTIGRCKLKALSPDGRCKTFDATANGYSQGEGCGVVVLKRLSDAIADGDSIAALIRGSAINHDGPSSGLTVPNRMAQRKVIQAALRNAKVASDRISYIEAHGTGTSLGDPIEIEALASIYGEQRSLEKPLIVGSVKTNFGHLEAAAGISSLIKVVLALQHQEIPPHLHFNQPNPLVDWGKLPIKIPTSPTPWLTEEESRMAGISSFGMSGTNVHVILEEQGAGSSPKGLASASGQGAEEQRGRGAEGEICQKRSQHILTLSAKTETALRDLAQRYQEHLNTHPELDIADVCFTANTGRAHFAENRLAIIAANQQELREKLNLFQADQEVAEIYQEKLDQNSNKSKIAWLFTGQGSQYINMGRQLYETQPVFRETLERCNDILKPYLDASLLTVLYPEVQKEQQSKIDQTFYTQPAIFALEYALATLWQSWGIEPDIVTGHSVGEYVAACVAGVFSLEDGLKLIAHRGRLMQALPDGGKMLAVLASQDQIQQVIVPYAEQVNIAAINGPESIVISGVGSAIAEINKTLEAKEIKTKFLQVSHAFHSTLMEPMLQEFAQIASQISYSSPKIPLISNVTGDRIGKEITTPEYWVNHVRQPVRFFKVMEQLQKEHCNIFLEIGSKPILLGMARQFLTIENCVWLPSLSPEKDDWQQMLASLGQLYLAGLTINWLNFDKHNHRRKLNLPTYPFQRQRYWIETKNKAIKIPNNQYLHPLLGQRFYSPSQPSEIQFQSQITATQPTYLSDHRVFDQVVLPGSAYLEMALAAGAELLNSDNLVLEDVLIQQAMILSEDEVKTVHLILKPLAEQSYEFQIFSLKLEQNQPKFTLHIQGKILAGTEEISQENQNLADWQTQCDQEIMVADFYQQHREQQGIHYGYTFQNITQLWHGDGQAWGEIKLPEFLAQQNIKYKLHPALLDASCQVLFAAFETTAIDQTYLPVSIKRLSLYRSNSHNLWSQVAITETNQQTVTGEVTLWDEAGMVAKLEGLTAIATDRQVLLRHLKSDISKWLYEVNWQAQAIADAPPSSEPGTWLLFTPNLAIAQKFAPSLQKQGHNCLLVTPGNDYQQLDAQSYQVNPTSKPDIQQLLTEISQHHDSIQGIIHLWSLQATVNPANSLEELTKAQELGVGNVLHLVQAIAESPQNKIPLWLVTQGTQAINNDYSPRQFQQATLWGLGKVIAFEHPELQCRCIDLDPNLNLEQAAKTLIPELLAPTSEDQIAYRDQIRYVARLTRHQAFETTQPVTVQSEASYLITGGLGALGLQVAEWMIDQGAKHIVLIGRKQPSTKVQEILDEWQQKGINAIAIAGDISQEQDLSKILDEIQISLPPLRGVVHAAGILEDSLLQQMSWQSFTKVMSPKVQGSWLLHKLTQNLPLDFFVCFSSMASAIGSPGQGNYAAANAFMDALAHYRRSIGLPGLSINWGPWAEVGMAARLEKSHTSRLQTQGITPINPGQGLLVLEQLLEQNSSQVGAMQINWDLWQSYMSNHRDIPLLANFKTAPNYSYKSQKSPPSLSVEQLQAASPEDQELLLEAYLKEQTARIMGLAAATLDVTQSLSSLGLDSLMAIELTNRISADLGVKLPMTQLISGDKITQITSALLEEIFPDSDAENLADLLADIEQMSESEVAALLEQE
ncbi:MAG: type I polyketide synthase [Cyanobacteria bacterium P01_F01_bin.143]